MDNTLVFRLYKSMELQWVIYIASVVNARIYNGSP